MGKSREVDVLTAQLQHDKTSQLIDGIHFREFLKNLTHEVLGKKITGSGEPFFRDPFGVPQNPEFTDDLPVSKLELEVASSKQYDDSIKDRDTVTYEVVETVVVATSSARGGGISGILPPLIKAPELAQVRGGEVVEKEGVDINFREFLKNLTHEILGKKITGSGEPFYRGPIGVPQNPDFTDDLPVSKLELEVALNKQYDDSIKDREGAVSGIHPPLIKAPESAQVRGGEVVEKEGVEVGIGRVNLKGKEEDGVLDVLNRVAESSLFSTTYNEDDSSRTSMEPRSNNVCPKRRIKRIITPGCWQKGKLLGGGSYGSVYEGISDDGFLFAVKEVSLLDQGLQGKQSVYQLEQEIALLSRFEHDNIVQYYGSEMDESKLHIFIELVAKGSLRSLYQSYTLRDSQVSSYTRQILHGLKYLHDQNVVHRDIKCANILVRTKGSVKLADFGLAKVTKLNDVKSCKGTAFWMAPEVVKQKGYGLPADVWSLGCTVLEMLTRQIPYSNLEPVQAIFRIGNSVLPPIPDTLSRYAKDFITQCLQVNPEDRPTAAQLLNHSFLQRPLSQSSSPYVRGRRG